jgi:PAS domain-containing protein
LTQLILRLESLHAGTDEPSALPVVDLGIPGRPPAASTPLSRWSVAVAATHDPCLVLDPQGQVLSLSASAADLLGCADVGVIGRPLLDVIDLIDFETGTSHPDYALRIAPLAVLHAAGGLMRSLLRVRRRGSPLTLDACAAPLHDAAGRTVGSLTFLAPVRG